MAFKRAGADKGAPSEDEEQLKVVDELVKKSLAINPNLRRGRDTQGVVEGLREEVAAKSRAKAHERAQRENAADGFEEPAPRLQRKSTAPTGKADPRQQTIDIFLRDKSATYPEEAAGLRRKIEAIEAELAALAEDTIGEVTQLVGVLLHSGAEPDATHETLRRYPDLWNQLGTSSAKVFDAARKK